MSGYSIYGVRNPEVSVDATRKFLDDLDVSPEGIQQTMIVQSQKYVAQELLTFHEESERDDFKVSAQEALLYEMTHHRFDPFSRSTSVLGNLEDDVRLAVIKDTLRDVIYSIRQERRASKKAEMKESFTS